MSAEKIITISARLIVTLEVSARRNNDGEVEITEVRRIIGLPSIRDISESMDSGDFEELDAAYDGDEEAQP